jgi:hypothetical protein
LSPVSGIKRKLDFESAKGSFWRKAAVHAPGCYSLLSITRLNMVRSRARPSIWSVVQIDQTCLGRSGGFARSACPCSNATAYEASG